jgi:dehypoxanthine futalosine cyclase
MSSRLHLSFKEGLLLFKEAPLEELRKAAAAFRCVLHPSNTVTYVLDTNPNYSNICTTCCSFCSFFKRKGAAGAFFKTVEEVMLDILEAKKAGATTVLLQGALSENTTLPYFVDLVQATRQHFPDIHPHFFSAPEIVHAARISGVSVEEALNTLFSAGLRTIPGGGAEILTETVHEKICPKKLSPKEWLETHKKAHKIGFLTTATMMFGHIETPDDIVEHLLRLRDAQEETGGFLSFIPWSYKPYHNALGKTISQIAPKEMYFRILAVSRLFLDNFTNISASWFGEGKEAGIVSLSYGANDFGGTVFAESVHKAAGHENSSTETEVRTMIRVAGFTPLRRDSLFQHN